MLRCHYCQRIPNNQPETCPLCGKPFCPEHVRPETHNCPHRFAPGRLQGKITCDTCGRSVSDRGYRCSVCNRILCSGCWMQGTHGCRNGTFSVVDMTAGPSAVPVPAPERISPAGFPALKWFAIISVVTLFLGTVLAITDPAGRTPAVIMLWGSLFCILAYSLYAVKCWQTGYRFLSLLLLCIPPAVGMVMTAMLPYELSVIAFLIILLFIIISIIAVIPVALLATIKTAVEERLLNIPRTSPKPPRIPYLVAALLCMTVFMTLMAAMLPATYPQAGAADPPAATAGTDPAALFRGIIPRILDEISTPPGSTQAAAVIRDRQRNAYETGPVTRTLSYVLRGKTRTIDITLYTGVYDKERSLPVLYTCYRYANAPSPCTAEEARQHMLTILDEPTQADGLKDLAEIIRMQAKDPGDQARIAISLVQRIPYDSRKTDDRLSDARYPYEVLYDNTGICSEKSLLLAYLLRELGFGVALFRFPDENHMALGLQCALPYSYHNSGYAFIESTRPSIPTFSQGAFVNYSNHSPEPEVYQISTGAEFTPISEEYEDARQLDEILAIGPEMLDLSHALRLDQLKKQYGLGEEKY